jgi:AcrR family transcriptional regulator
MKTIAIRVYDYLVPKIVDHEERRQLIVQAHQAEVAAHGFGATTYARIAAAAGVSVGTIQHYFADRSELVRYSFESLLQEREARVAALVAAGEKAGQTIHEMLLTALYELLPVNDERRREHSVGQQLRTEAWRDPDLHRLALANDERLLIRLRTAVENGKECGEVLPEVDAQIAAVRIVATVYGLADQLGLAPDSSPEQHLLQEQHDAVLAPVIRTVFTGECRHIRRQI